jgi:hypothetical protein
MTGHRTARQWNDAALPIMASLVSAEDRMVAAIDQPITLLACCDQLKAAFDHAEEWLDANPCPDIELGQNFDAFIRACGGIWSILSTGLHTDPAYRARCAGYLADRISTATEIRQYLQQWQIFGGGEL